MVFGEIVEPTTRALIDDEYEEYPQYEKSDLKWKGKHEVPADLQTLIFVEGSKIIKLFSAFITNAEVYGSLSAGDVQIYKTTNGKYIVSYTKKDIATGEILEELSEWLRKASYIYALISEPLSAYQNVELREKPETLIRKLSTNISDVFSWKKLEPPNLVSGLGADVLSLSLHTGLKSTLFVIYMDNSPFDSVNMNPVIELMKQLDLTVKPVLANLNPEASNLYL